MSLEASPDGVRSLRAPASRFPSINKHPPPQCLDGFVFSGCGYAYFLGAWIVCFLQLTTASESFAISLSSLHLFEAAMVDGHSAGVMRGSIQLRHTEPAANIEPDRPRAWARRVLTLLPLLKWFIPKNETLIRLEVLDLFHKLMACYPTLLKLKTIASNGEFQAIARLRSIFQRLGYVFCF